MNAVVEMSYSGCHVVYNGYDVVNYSGCDHRNTVVVISSTEWMWWHRYSGREVRYSRLDVLQKVVWCTKEWKWCHIEEIWCHECSVREVIKHDHWLHKEWMWCDVDWVWCHMCAKRDDLHTCCDIFDRALHRYRCVYHLCDEIDTVAVISNTVGEMSSIAFVLSWKKYGDSIHIGYVINILCVMLYIEGYSVINSCCYSMHREYDVTHIVRAMSYREWYGITDTLSLMTQIQWM